MAKRVVKKSVGTKVVRSRKKGPPDYKNIFKTFKPEDWVQYYWCQWMDTEHSSVLYHTNILQGARIHPVAAARAKLLGSRKGMPDVMVFKPMGEYGGLFLELKREGETIYTKSGGVKADKKEQFEMLERLRSIGYAAYFACGLAEAKQLTEDYLGGELF